MKTFFLILLLTISLNAGWKTQRENLDKVYILGDFRVFYTLKGKDALPRKNRVDLNKNSIPDYVENIAQRLNVTKELYTKILGFQDPLKSKRYRGVKYIDIHILNSKHSSSGDAVVTFNYKILDKEDEVISMKIRNNLDKDTLTPSHEYFHLLQNSYSMFKNRWYTEGTARWSERVFKKGTGKRGILPQNSRSLDVLLDMTYDAKGFWRKLAYLCDTNNGSFVNSLNLKTDVPNYPNLIEDRRIYGYEFIRVFLENLDKQDNIVSKKRGYGEFDWSEKNQKYNEDNNKYILKAVVDTINTVCPKTNQEINNFKIVAKDYIRR
ncbi:MAG: hypothetical protein ACNI25_16745 [Halarcobacter sp.]